MNRRVRVLTYKGMSSYKEKTDKLYKILNKSKVKLSSNIDENIDTISPNFGHLYAIFNTDLTELRHFFNSTGTTESSEELSALDTNELTFINKVEAYKLKTATSNMSTKSSKKSSKTRSSSSRISTTLALKHAEAEAAKI